MKRFIFLAALALTTTVALADTKIATINMERVITLHPKTKENRLLLLGLQKDYENKRDELLATIKPTVNAFRAAVEAAQDESLKESARKAKVDEARALENKMRREEEILKDKIAEIQIEFQKQELELFEEVTGSIGATVKEYAAKENITLVLDASAMRASAPVSVVVFADKSLDITDQIIELTGGKKPE